jgi:formate dehydrogenase major subunit
VPQGLGQRAAGQQRAAQKKVLYRRPHGTDWEELDLETATTMVADRMLETRERTCRTSTRTASA